MSKTKEQLLQDYKRTNKTRRSGIVKRAGFASEADYLAYLMDDEDEVKPYIHNVHIVDASTSMTGGKIHNAIKGVNAELDRLRKDETTEYVQTIVVFSDSSKIVTAINKVPINQVPTFTTRANGMTALNQAIGETLSKLSSSQEENEKVLVKIFTDGGENDSTGPFKEPENLSKLIKECEAKGFTVTFVGTKDEVAYAVDMLDVDLSNTLVHDNTMRGVEMAFRAMADSTESYTRKVKEKKAVQKGFFKDIK